MDGQGHICFHQCGCGEVLRGAVRFRKGSTAAQPLFPQVKFTLETEHSFSEHYNFVSLAADFSLRLFQATPPTRMITTLKSDGHGAQEVYGAPQLKHR